VSATLSRKLEILARIARAAGDVVMKHYAAGVEARFKDDRSPVTDADQEAEALILAALAREFPGVPVVAEEEAAAGRIAQASAHFFLVDPLDGTKEFIARRGGQFTVNIGEIVDGTPVAGVVYAPALDRLFVGSQDDGAFEQDGGGTRIIMARAPAPDGLVAVSSKSHPDEKTAHLLKSLPIRESINAGSSLKFCLLAAGEADIYPRAGRTMEWDTAAGHAVLAAAGGAVTDWDGAPFTYGKPGYENGAFIARGK
jgi:3'(2'), 5'-bisphosphate nucleotidase